MFKFLFEHLKHQIVEHAESVFPEEACGVVFDGQYVPCKNVDLDPENYFSFSQEDEYKYLVNSETKHLTQAIVHSHPIGPVCPSETDMKMQISTGLPCVLLAHDDSKWVYLEWGEHALDVPLLERPFVHGILDCYSLVRSYFWQERGVKLRDYPRNDDWWEIGETLYSENFAKEGFVEIDPGVNCNQLQVGDCFLYKLAGPPGGQKVESHAGVYVGNGEILHHLPNRLSEKTALHSYGVRASRWVRYAK